jgi:hypothetical protein
MISPYGVVLTHILAQEGHGNQPEIDYDRYGAGRSQVDSFTLSLAV